jgi:hypothetical protein
MKGQRTLIVVLTVALTLVLAVGLSQAEGPEHPEDETLPEGTGLATPMNDVIPIQGKLTDASGNPINGSRSITFSLYDVSAGGTALCSDTDTVSVVNGLFNAEMDFCTAADINGRQLWLGIKVGSDPEMSPRQGIYAVPYAWGLRPGAIIGGSGAGDGTLYLYDGSGNQMIRLDAGHGAVYLGGVGDDGDVVIYNSTGVTETIVLDGESGLVELGGVGQDGDIYVRSSADTLTFQVDGATGDVKQYRTGDGLVKAGVFATCGTSASMGYFFNNVGGTITIANGASAGHCTIDFNFDISDRYFVALGMEDNVPRGVSCSRSGLPDDQLHCFRWDAGGNGVSGQIMVLVY